MVLRFLFSVPRVGLKLHIRIIPGFTISFKHWQTKCNSYHSIKLIFVVWEKKKPVTVLRCTVRRISFARTSDKYQRAWKVHCLFHGGTFERFNFLFCTKHSNMIVMQQQQLYSAHWSVMVIVLGLRNFVQQFAYKWISTFEKEWEWELK